jgi:acyl-CoA reductase-like NAD-dependent aldehyde dehydrogenase
MSTVGLEQQQLLIGGRWTDARSGRTHEKSNPFTGESAGSASAAGRADARAAVDAAQAAFPGWSATAPASRAEILTRASELLMERQADIATIVTEETGATVGWGMFNVELGAGMLAYYAGRVDSLAEESIPSHIPGKDARAIRQPVGVVVGIAPWNAPVILGARAIAAPLAYGNTVVLKASEECPRTHAAIVHALVDAGLPDGVINLITNDPADAGEVVGELIAHPAVRRVNFTGSTRVGRIVAENAARHLKRALLELGGKAPMVVLADADLERAVAAANFGSFMHQGQICMSTERIVVDEAIAEDFAQKLGERARALKVGDPRDPQTQIGPLVNGAAVERITELVQDAESQGARVLSGGKPDGPCFPPTVLMGVTPEMRIYSEESFGPVVSIVPIKGTDEAVQTANDTEYGLSSAVFSADLATARQVASRLQTGMCHINDTTVHDEPQMPFGGVKDSGWGRFGGDAALEEFTELRWITVQKSPRQYPI